MKILRSSGILLHITSLPGAFGIGDLGPESRWFVDVLTEAKQKFWCILPLGPTGAENSPYQSPSAFAANPLMISPEELVREGYLSRKELRSPPPRSSAFINFPAVNSYKDALFRKAFLQFSETRKYKAFEHDNAWWLDSFARFMALRDANGGLPWTRFDSRVTPTPQAVRYYKFIQYEFDRQWKALRKYCDARNVSLMGDTPFYVEHDSADVWSYPQFFDLRRDGESRTVGGVPPDYFSKDGQRWGTPTYRWDKLEETGFTWWVDRFRVALARTEILRLDHFRGFEAFWRVPAQDSTARHGRWVKGPGAKLFDALQKHLGQLPFVAENLGIVTRKVEDLRCHFQLPGMAVFQFGFDGDATHRPCNYRREMVAFTGTHDNDTVRGWWRGVCRAAISGKKPKARSQLLRIASYLQANERHLHWSIIQAIHTSVADLAIVPMQDILGLGANARMNVPGRAKGNWRWRLQKKQLRPEMLQRLRDLTVVCGR